MNKPLNPQETPTELIEDLNAYSRIFETTMAGMADKHNMEIPIIARLFNRAALEITERYITLTPTPPFPLLRDKQQPESIKFLTRKDILEEDTALDTRVLAEKTPSPAETEPTPSIPIVFESDGLTPTEQQPTPDIFEQPTPTHAKDTEYQALITLAVPNPDFSTGPLPKYVQYDHDLSPTPQNPVRPKIIFSFSDTSKEPPEWTLTGAVRELADVEFEPSTPYSNTPDYITKGFSATPAAPLELDWEDLSLDTDHK